MSICVIYVKDATQRSNMKVLNLYSGLGGNRTLWQDVEVTAVEYDPEIAAVYKDRFPDDEVIVEDAHAYLIENFHKFDLVWSSPPCQTHSSFRQNIGVRYRGVAPIYPDMKLYQEIIFLQYNSQKLWVVENVKPYYEPLIQPTSVLQRHLLWANFDIGNENFISDRIRDAQIPQLQELHGIDLSPYKIANKRQLLRNCVSKELGKWVLDHAVAERLNNVK
jgi:DNA (cytosine-5)-methyltransferase 1